MTNLLLWKAFWNLTVTGLALGSIYALIALGYTLVYGVLRLINFAHSEVFMVGTMGAFVATTKWLRIDLLVNGDYPYKTGLALIGVHCCRCHGVLRRSRHSHRARRVPTHER
jgi:branched-subunit amino acid ABC-type transport system permease component